MSCKVVTPKKWNVVASHRFFFGCWPSNRFPPNRSTNVSSPQQVLWKLKATPKRRYFNKNPDEISWEGQGSLNYHRLGGGNSNIIYFHPYLGKIPILINDFQMGWSHIIYVHPYLGKIPILINDFQMGWNHIIYVHPYLGKIPILINDFQMGWNHIIYFHPYLGKIPILINDFQMGWNHQLDRNLW